MSETQQKIKYTNDAYFFSCPKGAEQLLHHELEELSTHFLENLCRQKNVPHPSIKAEHGGVTILNTREDLLFFLLLHTRMASRAFQKIFYFSLSSLEKSEGKTFYEQIYSYPFTKLFSPHATFKIQTLISYKLLKRESELLHNSHYLSLVVKDAIVDRFQKEFGQRPKVDTQNPDVSCLIHIGPSSEESKSAMVKTEEDVEEEHNITSFQVSFLVDLVGTPLSHRFYRKDSETFKAPLRENLAAILVKLTNWNPDSEIFIDTMCGSGTVLIEALLMKAKLPPSTLRVLEKQKDPRQKLWAFENLFPFKTDEMREKWNLALKQALKEIGRGFTLLREWGNDPQKSGIYAYDIDPNAIKICFQNLNAYLFKAHSPNFTINYGEDRKDNNKSSSKQEIISALPPFPIQISKRDACKIYPPIVKEKIDLDSTKTTLDTNEFTDLPKSKGVVFCNPPYGVRLGNVVTDFSEAEKIGNLYFDYFENLKKFFAGFRAYIFTGNLDLKKRIKLKPKSKYPIFNGDIDCRLFFYDLY